MATKQVMTGYETVITQETGYNTLHHEAALGYDPIPIHRPIFIFFEFVGLRPNVPHWIFFGNKEVTRYCNTSYDEASYEANAHLKEPGEAYLNATSFPSGGSLTFSGPTNGGSAMIPVNSDQYGVLSGVFYLQSNSAEQWAINTDGHQLVAIDISVLKKSQCLSYGAGLFRGKGQYHNYYQFTTQEAYTYDVETQVEVWEDVVEEDEPSGTGGGNNNNGGGDGGSDTNMGYYQLTNWSGTHNYYGDLDDLPLHVQINESTHEFVDDNGQGQTYSDIQNDTSSGGAKETYDKADNANGTHCCTASQNRGDMSLTEVKKLRAWHRKQSVFWQEGYDVWGKVIADHLVAKSKWQSDRVRDFYYHKIYGKRTIGSIYADIVIFPLSYLVGIYKVTKNYFKKSKIKEV